MIDRYIDRKRERDTDKDREGKNGRDRERGTLDIERERYFRYRERGRGREREIQSLSHLSSATFQSISGVRCHPCITTNLFYTTFEISATTLRGATDNTDVNLICCNCFMLILFARSWLSDLLWRRLARHYCLLVGETEGLKMRNVTICHNMSQSKN